MFGSGKSDDATETVFVIQENFRPALIVQVTSSSTVSETASGPIVQDTFIQVLNYYFEDVRVQLYLVNGDPCSCNWVDNQIVLTVRIDLQRMGEACFRGKAKAMADGSHSISDGSSFFKPKALASISIK